MRVNLKTAFKSFVATLEDRLSSVRCLPPRRASRAFWIALTAPFFIGAIQPVLAKPALKSYPIVSPATITVTPSDPGPGNIIHLVVDTGILCFLGGQPMDGVTVSVNNEVITLTAFTSRCFDESSPPPPFHFVQDIGPLPPGLYTINLFYRNQPSIIPGQPEPPYDPPVQLLTQQLAVSGGAIPTMSDGGLAMLSIAFMLAAYLILRRRRPWSPLGA